MSCVLQQLNTIADIKGNGGPFYVKSCFKMADVFKMVIRLTPTSPVLIAEVGRLVWTVQGPTFLIESSLGYLLAHESMMIPWVPPFSGLTDLLAWAR